MYTTLRLLSDSICDPIEHCLCFHRSLAEKLPISVSPDSYDSPHTKTHLLLQAHFSSAPLPIADYVTDTKSVLDQALRILQVSPKIDITFANTFHIHTSTAEYSYTALLHLM